MAAELNQIDEKKNKGRVSKSIKTRITREKTVETRVCREMARFGGSVGDPVGAKFADGYYKVKMGQGGAGSNGWSATVRRSKVVSTSGSTWKPRRKEYKKGKQMES